MFDRKKPEPISTPAQEPSVAPAPQSYSHQHTTRVVQQPQKPLIGRNVRINGDIDFDGELVIEGLVNGDVFSEDPNAHLVIQDTASIDGNVRVATIQQNGIINGSVESSGLLTVSATGSVTGPVKYNQLVLEMGAIVNGSLEQVFTEAPRYEEEQHYHQPAATHSEETPVDEQ